MACIPCDQKKTMYQRQSGRSAEEAFKKRRRDGGAERVLSGEWVICQTGEYQVLFHVAGR